MWSGSMQRDGTTELCLSTYSGRSSLYQSANWERFDDAYAGCLNSTRKTPVRNGVKDDEVKKLLIVRKHSIAEICRIAGVSNRLVARCRAELRAVGGLVWW